MLYTQKASDRAEARGGSRAQVALAWLRPNPVVVAPLVPATKPSHLDDAMAWLEIAAADLRVDPHAAHRGGLLHEPFGQARSQCDLASARPGIVFVDCLENTLASGAKAGVGRAPFARFQAIQARGADDRTP